MISTILSKDHTLDRVTVQVFEDLIMPLKNKLFRFALSYLKDADEAKDVVQDVLIRTWEELRDDKAIRNVESWCMTLVKNRSLDRLKKSGRNYLQLVDRQELAHTDDPLRAVVRKEKHQMIRNLIADLPTRQQEVIVLRDMEGYSYKEICEILAIDMNNLKVLLHRSRSALRTALIQHQINGN